jgi:hypothetical protein
MNPPLISAQPSAASYHIPYALLVCGLTGYVLRRLLWLQSIQPGYHCGDLDLATLACCFVALLLLGYDFRCLVSIRSRVPVIGAVLGVLFFVATIGFGLADPTNIEWLLRGDWAQHFVGWHLYRSSPWSLPPGAFDADFFPVGTAVIYTDSLPLLAMPLKAISWLLPARFQYIGLWLLLNCVLQGVFAIMLVRVFSARLSVQAIGAGLLLLAPIFLSRTDHDTLTSQWLILVALWLYLREDTSVRRQFLAWLMIAAVSALVHPYLNAMVLALAVAYFVRVAVSDRLLSKRHALLQLAALINATAACWWLAGAFILSPGSGGVSLGKYNANLLTWFDSNYMSRWLPALPEVGSGQYEGRAYLGLGILILLVVSVCVRGRLRQLPEITRPLWPLLCVTFLLTAYAFGPRLSLGSFVLADLTPQNTGILGAFRATGRFIWPSVYLLTLWPITMVARRFGRIAPWLLGAAFFVQLLDLAPLQVRIAQYRVGHYDRQEVTVLHDGWWDQAVIGKKHITLVPPPACGNEAAPYFPFSLLAGDHHLTVNTGYLARFDEERTSAYCDKLQAEIDAGKRHANALYIVSHERLDHFLQTSNEEMNCRNVEGFVACATAPNVLARMDQEHSEP